MTMSDRSAADGTKRRIDEFEEDPMPPKKLYVDRAPLTAAALLAKLNENERRKFEFSNLMIEPFDVEDKSDSEFSFGHRFQQDVDCSPDVAPLAFNPEEDDIDDDEYSYYEELQKPLDQTCGKMVYQVTQEPKKIH